MESALSSLCTIFEVPLRFSSLLGSNKFFPLLSAVAQNFLIKLKRSITILRKISKKVFLKTRFRILPGLLRFRDTITHVVFLAASFSKLAQLLCRLPPPTSWVRNFGPQADYRNVTRKFRIFLFYCDIDGSRVGNA